MSAGVYLLVVQKKVFSEAIPLTRYYRQCITAYQDLNYRVVVVARLAER